MNEHRCPKCNKLLFKFKSDADIVHGKVEIETQHHCRADENKKVKDIKVFATK